MTTGTDSAPQGVVQVDGPDMWILILATIRYSMGRRTYITGVCAELVRSYGCVLLNAQLGQIRDEIWTEMRRYEERGQWLGDECDHRAWQGLCQDIANELVRRNA